MSEFTHHDFSSHDASHDHHDTHDTHHGGHHNSELYGAAPIAAAPAVHGDPAQAAPYYFVQHYTNDCLLASITQVLSEASGHTVPEDVVIQHMQQLHVHVDEHGIQFEDGLKILQSFDIPSHAEQGATLQQLESYLDHGRSVILGVDGPVIWNALHGTNQPDTGHAVLLTSIDTAKGTVTLSDTGTPDGIEETVPLAVFEQAWAVTGDQVIVTDVTINHHPGPALLPLTLQPHHHAATPAPTQAAPAPHAHTPDTHSEPAHHTSTTPAPGMTYTVQPGDTLWNIAENAYGNGTAFNLIAQANGITNPGHIQPGQVISIPAHAQ
jgi:LysM repeat protein